MNFWWVNHKQTFKAEIEGGYIWSPQKNKNGGVNQTYLNLPRTKPGDVIFSFASGIRAVGIVSGICKLQQKPLDFGISGNSWENNGWAVPVKWTVLKKPFNPKDHLALISPLLPSKYSPIRPDGNGNQGVYLASISEELGVLIFGLLNANSPILPRFEEFQEVFIEKAQEEVENDPTLTSTEKQQLIMARRGQGLFRRKVEEVEPGGCRLTKVQEKTFLTASHIKPWSAANNEERLDGHNGLLLSPHVDRLFDQGWISFHNDGTVLIATELVKKIMSQWHLDFTSCCGPFTDRQKKYLEWHRTYVFRGFKK